jgi:hypothetical protein
VTLLITDQQNMRILLLVAISVFFASCGFMDALVENTKGKTNLKVTSDKTTLYKCETASISAAGGSGSYSYGIVSGPGSVDSSTGVFTANTAGTTVISATDIAGLKGQVELTTQSGEYKTGNEVLLKGFIDSASTKVSKDGSIQLENAFHTYTSTTTPAVTGNYPLSTFYHESTDYLYVSTNNAGTLIFDTQGTTTMADDTSVGVYNTTSTPALPNNANTRALVDDDQNLIYIATSAGLVVLDHKSTNDPTDDTIVTNIEYWQYSSSSQQLCKSNGICQCNRAAVCGNKRWSCHN